jgi:HSP20 family protein
MVYNLKKAEKVKGGFHMKGTNRIDVNSKPAWTESTANGRPFSRNPYSTSSKPLFENSGVSVPAVNIIETRADLRLEMVAPGMKKEAFKITLDEDVLTVSYDHEDNQQGARRDWKYRLREYNYHSFMRSFQLPDTVDLNHIEANYIDGILNIVISKKKEAISRRIAVE